MFLKEVFIFLFICDFLKWLKLAMETYSSSKTSFEGTLCVVDRYEKNWKMCIMCNVQSFIKIGILHEHKSWKLHVNVLLIFCYSN